MSNLVSSGQSGGVYQNEVNRSYPPKVVDKSITIGCIVGESNKGPAMQRTFITSRDEYLEVFEAPTPKGSPMHYSALAFLASGKKLYVTRVIQNDCLTAGAYLTVDDISVLATPQAAVNIHLTNWLNEDNTVPKGKYDPLNTIQWETDTNGAYGVGNSIPNVLGFFCAANPGEWNSRLYVMVSPALKRGQDLEDIDDPTIFKVSIFLDYNTLETAVNVPVESYLVSLDYRIDGNNNQMNIEDVINLRSKLVRFRLNPNAMTKFRLYTSTGEFLAGGTNGTKPDVNDILAGWELYADPDKVRVNTLINSGYTNVKVHRAMINIAGSRTRCIAILDAPTNAQEASPYPYNPILAAGGTVDAEAQRAYAEFYVASELNADTTYAAIFTPNVKIWDNYNKRYVWIPPSGLVAGAFAFTDTNFAPWFAAAGLVRAVLDIAEVAYVYDKSMRDSLETNNINTIRGILQEDGSTIFAVWGNATLAKVPSALSHIHVRRLLNTLADRIDEAFDESTFDPNDAILRQKLTADANHILQPILDHRGLYWYAVICDDTNNTPDSIMAGEIRVDIFLDPMMVAKRLHLNAIITKTGAAFTEAAIDRSKSAASQASS